MGRKKTIDINVRDITGVKIRLTDNDYKPIGEYDLPQFYNKFFGRGKL